jgi:hypothetical protein
MSTGRRVFGLEDAARASLALHLGDALVALITQKHGVDSALAHARVLFSAAMLWNLRMIWSATSVGVSG